MQEIQLYPYISPSGGGMTSSKELADRMEALRVEYIKAHKSKDYELESRIKEDEKALLLQIHNIEAKQRLEAYDRSQKTKVPRVVRVICYHKSDKEDLIHVYLDTHEVEMISVPAGLAGPYLVRMKSGGFFETSEDDFNLIERAMKERE